MDELSHHNTLSRQFPLPAWKYYFFQPNIAVSQRPSMSVSIFSINSSFTRISEATLALSRCGLRPPRGLSERSRHTRRFPRKQEVCKKASRQFALPAWKYYFFQPNIAVSQRPSMSVSIFSINSSFTRISEAYFEFSRWELKLLSRAMYPPPCGYYLFFL